MIPQLTIPVTFVIGTSIENAALESSRLSEKLRVCIEFDFNGVKCLVFPEGNPDKLVSQYREDCKRKKPRNFVSNR